jgi:hypothetical protein
MRNGEVWGTPATIYGRWRSVSRWRGKSPARRNLFGRKAHRNWSQYDPLAQGFGALADYVTLFSTGKRERQRLTRLGSAIPTEDRHANQPGWTECSGSGLRHTAADYMTS